MVINRYRVETEGEKNMNFIKEHWNIDLVIFTVMTTILLSVVMIVGSGNIALADGAIEDAYVIKADGEVLATVSSKMEGNMVVEKVVEEYTGLVGTDQSLSITPAVIIERAYGNESGGEVLNIDEAAKAVVETNDAEEPLFEVESRGVTEFEKTVKPKTVYKKDSSLEKGKTKVVRKGKSGITKYTQIQRVVNGEIVGRKTLEKEVVKKSVSKVVKKGTKEDTSKAIVSYAEKFLGNPYVWGGNSLTNGVDCSGFVKGIWAHYGVSLPRTSTAMRSVGTAVSLSEAKAGDLVCYSGHVALYTGNGSIIHASSPSTGIIRGTANYRNILTIRRVS